MAGEGPFRVQEKVVEGGGIYSWVVGGIALERLIGIWSAVGE